MNFFVRRRRGATWTAISDTCILILVRARRARPAEARPPPLICEAGQRSVTREGEQAGGADDIEGWGKFAEGGGRGAKEGLGKRECFHHCYHQRLHHRCHHRHAVDIITHHHHVVHRRYHPRYQHVERWIFHGLAP